MHAVERAIRNADWLRRRRVDMAQAIVRYDRDVRVTGGSRRFHRRDVSNSHP